MNPLECPFKGLQPLDREDALILAGRGKDIEILVSNLYGSSLTVLYGESGVGKTSLIRAGLVPELERPVHRVAVVVFREWQSPRFEEALRASILESLLEAINRLKQAEGARTVGIDALENYFTYSLKFPVSELPFDHFVKECCTAFYGRMFFIFDQFEEYFYYHPAHSPGGSFDAVFARCINDSEIPASFLLSLREDGLAKLDRLRGRIPGLLGNLVRLHHLDRAGALEALTKPLNIYNQGQPPAARVSLDGLLVEKLLGPENTSEGAQGGSDQYGQLRDDILELDDLSDGAMAKPMATDEGRFKAVAIDAVMHRLWESEISTNPGEPTGGRILSFRGLRLLAQGAPLNTTGDLVQRVGSIVRLSEGESEAKFVLRTYFDARMEQVLLEEREDVAEILRSLVRPGGKKKAGSVASLARETHLSASRVKRTLDHLLQKPYPILVQIKDSNPAQFELQHDVMAFALKDWCDRQRLVIQEHRESERRRATRLRNTEDHFNAILSRVGNPLFAFSPNLEKARVSVSVISEFGPAQDELRSTALKSSIPPDLVRGSCKDDFDDVSQFIVAIHEGVLCASIRITKPQFGCPSSPVLRSYGLDVPPIRGAWEVTRISFRQGWQALGCILACELIVYAYQEKVDCFHAALPVGYPLMPFAEALGFRRVGSVQLAQALPHISLPLQRSQLLEVAPQECVAWALTAKRWLEREHKVETIAEHRTPELAESLAQFEIVEEDELMARLAQFREASL